MRVTEELPSPHPYGRNPDAARLAGTQMLSRCIRGFIIGVSSPRFGGRHGVFAALQLHHKANAAQIPALARSLAFGTRVATSPPSARSEVLRNEWRPVSNQGNSGLLTPRGLKITGTAFSNEPTILPHPVVFNPGTYSLSDATCSSPYVEATALAFRDSNWVDF